MVSADAIYHTGWLSVDGGDWRSFELSGRAYGDSERWLAGTATYSIPFLPAGEHYVLTYACNRTADQWNCSDNRWQLELLTVTQEDLLANAKSPLLAGVPLIHDQTFLIPETAASGDTVGDLNLMWVSPEQNIVFSLVDDANGRFVLDVLNNRDTVSNHLLDYDVRISVATATFDFDVQDEHQLTVRATDQFTGEYQDAIITVKLSREENTYYIDPDWVGCEDGTRTCPFNSWIDDVSGGFDSWRCGSGFLVPGMTILQKRGTVYEHNLNGEYMGFCTNVPGTPENHIVLGAYGEGERPLFKSVTQDSTNNIEGGGFGIRFTSRDVAYYDFYSLGLTQQNFGFITNDHGFNQITFTDMYFFNNYGNGVYLWLTERDENEYFNQSDALDRYARFSDSYSEGNGFVPAGSTDPQPDNNYGFKFSGALWVDVENVVSRFNENHGFSNAAATGRYRYVQSFGNRIGIKAHGNNMLIDYGLITNNSDVGIFRGNYYLRYDLFSDGFLLNNSLIANNSQGMTIVHTTENGVIENSVFEDNTDRAVYTSYSEPYGHPEGIVHNFTFRNNVFRNNGVGFYLDGLLSDPVYDFFIYQNQFYDNFRNPFYLAGVEYVEILNNVFYNNSVSLSGSEVMDMYMDDYNYYIGTVVAKNNLLGDGIGTERVVDLQESNNLYADDSFFVAASSRNFSLASGSPAIDAGVDVGLPFEGVAPDIGAFESNNVVEEPDPGPDPEPVGDDSCLRTFYVANAGSDADDGLSEFSAWKTIQKLNAESFLPGDCIFFKRGDVWRGSRDELGNTYSENMFVLQSSGNASHPIVYGAYGDALNPKPKLYGSLSPSDWAQDTGYTNVWRSTSVDVSYHPKSISSPVRYGAQVFFEETDETVSWGKNRPFDCSDFSVSCNTYSCTFTCDYYSEVVESWTAGLSVDGEVFPCTVTSSNPGVPGAPVCDYVCDVDAINDFDVGYFLTEEYMWAHRDGSIYVYSPENPSIRYNSVEAPQRSYVFNLNSQAHVAFDNLDMRYVTLAGVYEVYNSPIGIPGLDVTHSHIGNIGFKDSGAAFGISSRHSDAYFAYNEIHDCGRRAISIANYGDNAGDSMDNILIEHNYFYNGWHTTGVDAIIDGETHSANNITIRYNLFEGDPTLTSADGSSSNLIFHSRRNGARVSNFLVYGNRFVTPTGFGLLFENSENVSVFHNVFYGFNPYMNSFHSLIQPSGSSAKNFDVRNNIVYMTNLDGEAFNGFVLEYRDNTINDFYGMLDYNLYYADDPDVSLLSFYNWNGGGSSFTMGDWEAYTTPGSNDFGAGEHCVGFVDPLFVDAPNGNFSLQSESPAVDAGTLIPGFHCPTAGEHPESDCVTWYGLAPDIGAYESPYTAPALQPMCGDEDGQCLPGCYYPLDIDCIEENACILADCQGDICLVTEAIHNDGCCPADATHLTDTDCPDLN